MSDSKTSYFWYSAQHAKYLATVGVTATTIVIGGTRMEYTAARDNNAKEPYDGALRRFSDYRLLGAATWDTFKKGPAKAELVFFVDSPGEHAAGLRGFSERVTVTFDDTTKDCLGVEGVDHFRTAIAEWFDVGPRGVMTESEYSEKMAAWNERQIPDEDGAL